MSDYFKLVDPKSRISLKVTRRVWYHASIVEAMGPYFRKKTGL